MRAHDSFMVPRPLLAWPGVRTGVLRRACACGNHGTASGECSACATKKHSLQRQLGIGARNDPLEVEADRVAGRVLAGASPTSLGTDLHHIQRGAAGSAEVNDVAPQSVEDTLASTGQPLAPALREDMEQRFARDFSQVRIHDGATADVSTRAVGAHAYTFGPHIAFAAGRYAPGSAAGRHLLAHELAHVVQQSAAPAAVLQRQPAADEAKPAPKSPWKTGGSICKRDTRENVDFPATHISQVNVDLTSQNLTIDWVNPSGLSLPAGPFGISAGAGKCCLDCDDETTSRTGGTLCTPKGIFPVHDKGCVLSTAKWARNPTYFSRSGIAIHAGPLPGFPASHGCVRTTPTASEIIHDNSVYGAAYAPRKKAGATDRRTQIAVIGTWSGTQCYNAKKEAVKRSEACAKPKSKSPPAPTGAADTAAPEPVAMLSEAPGAELEDGPGPA